MTTSFTKMHGLGNDFVVIDGINQSFSLNQQKVQRLADRRFGVGCDQVLVVEAADDTAIDFRYRIYNADGGEVEQCGNGARCFARFVHDKGLTEKTEITVETSGGIIKPRLESDGSVSVDMGVPEFNPERIPFDANGRQDHYELEIENKTVEIYVLAIGNPHAVQIVKDVEMAPVLQQGPQIEQHPRFPNRVNAGFMQIIDRQHIRLRVYERGAGETLACGSGACAAVIAGRQAGLLDDKVEVSLLGGHLFITWQGEGKSVQLTGPVATVYEGEINLDGL